MAPCLSTETLPSVWIFFFYLPLQVVTMFFGSNETHRNIKIFQKFLVNPFYVLVDLIYVALSQHVVRNHLNQRKHTLLKQRGHLGGALQITTVFVVDS